MRTGWFLIPYKINSGRHVAIHEFTSGIYGGGGAWSESEISGNQAVVRVRTTSRLFSTLPFPELSETEAARAVVALGNRHTKPLYILASAVTEKSGSRELAHLISLWQGIGFGQRWRIPSSLIPLLALKIGEPTRFWRQMAQLCFDQRGAFPTTSVLDNFNRADENPLGNGNWSNPWYAGLNNLKILTNEVTSTGSGFGSAWWSASTFGPDSECFATIAGQPTLNQAFNVIVRSVNNNTASLDGYQAHFETGAVDDTVQIQRIDDTATTTLGATITQGFINGDAIGVEIIGSTLRAYRKPSGGSWAQIGTDRTDATYSAAGNIALGIGDNISGKADDFGGGTVIAGGAPTTKKLAALGVG